MASFQPGFGSQLEVDALKISKEKQFKMSAAHLQMEGFKVESILKLMNQCADSCRLNYRSDGI